MRGRKQHHARQQQEKRQKPLPQQAARLKKVFEKEPSSDVDPLDLIPRVYVLTTWDPLEEP